jgi:hypothetical protein
MWHTQALLVYLPWHACVIIGLDCIRTSRDHVLSCATCQKCKPKIHPSTVPIGELPPTLPLTRFHMDFFGPLRKSDGKRFILMILDSTSQWPKLITADNLEEKTICEALFNNVVSCFGLPRSMPVVSDNGTTAFAETFANIYGIMQHFTPSYHNRLTAVLNILAKQFLNL